MPARCAADDHSECAPSVTSSTAASPRSRSAETARSASKMSSVGDVFLGAVLAVGTGATLQLLIIPAAERAKRHADRWETTVLRLGETLAVELPPALNEARAASLNWAWA